MKKLLFSIFCLIAVSTSAQYVLYAPVDIYGHLDLKEVESLPDSPQPYQLIHYNDSLRIYGTDSNWHPLWPYNPQWKVINVEDTIFFHKKGFSGGFIARDVNHTALFFNPNGGASGYIFVAANEDPEGLTLGGFETLAFDFLSGHDYLKGFRNDTTRDDADSLWAWSASAIRDYVSENGGGSGIVDTSTHKAKQIAIFTDKAEIGGNDKLRTSENGDTIIICNSNNQGIFKIPVETGYTGYQFWIEDDNLPLRINDQYLGNQHSAGWRLSNVAASATTPTLVPNANFDDHGIGSHNGALSFIYDGSEKLRVGDGIEFMDTIYNEVLAIFEDSVKYTGYSLQSRYGYLYIDSINNMMKVDSAAEKASFANRMKLPAFIEFFNDTIDGEYRYYFINEKGDTVSEHGIKYGDEPLSRVVTKLNAMQELTIRWLNEQRVRDSEMENRLYDLEKENAMLLREIIHIYKLLGKNRFARKILK